MNEWLIFVLADKNLPNLFTIHYSLFTFPLKKSRGFKTTGFIFLKSLFLYHLGPALIKGAELGLEFFLCHLENVDTEKDTEYGVDDSNYLSEEGDAAENYSDDACLGLTLHKARNANGIEKDSHNAEKCLVHNMYSLNYFCMYILYI